MHFTVAAHERWGSTLFGGFFNFGDAGVDIFFVLSGFIMTYTVKKSLNNSANFSTFLKRRFVRIFPIYWIIISGFLLLQILLPSFYPNKFPFSVSELLSTYFLLPGHTMVNGVSWTLSYELFFYFLFSLAFLIKNKQTLWALSILYIIAIIVLPLLQVNTQTGNRWINLIAYSMNIEFFMGIATALLIPKLDAKFARPLLAAGVVLFLASAISINYSGSILPGAFNRVLIFGFPSRLILTGIVRYELSNYYNVHNIFVLLGEASYSLYLIHLPFVVAFITILSRYKPFNFVSGHLLFLFSIIIVSAVSIFFYKLVEKPIIFKLNGGSKK